MAIAFKTKDDIHLIWKTAIGSNKPTWYISSWYLTIRRAGHPGVSRKHCSELKFIVWRDEDQPWL